MCLFSLAQIESDLKCEIQSPPSEALFLRFVSQLPSDANSHLSGWPDLRQSLDRLGFKAQRSDPLIRQIIRGYQGDGDGTWTSVAVYLFWRPLRQIYFGLRGLDEPHILFAEIHWRFLAALSRIDLSRREREFGKKLLNDTRADTRRSYRTFYGHHVQFEEDEYDELPEQRIGSHYWTAEDIESSVGRSWAIERLRSLARDGSLSRPDYQILLGCYIYGRSLDQMAEHLGITYGAAKKRRQRATKKLRENASDLSPNPPARSLYPLERSTRKEADHVRKL